MLSGINYMLTSYWLMPVLAFISALGFTPLVIALAKKKEWVAYPKADRWHTKPVALMGGLAIYASVTAVLVLDATLFATWLWIGASVMFITGLLDDRIQLSPIVKLLAQLFSASLLLFAGYSVIPDLPVWVSIPLTFFWIIGVTNAVNLLDNMDGLAPGISTITLGFTGVLLFSMGETSLGILVLVVAGATAGFLVFNFKPAKVFMGDSGSLFLGYMLSAGILALINSSPTASGWTALFLAVSIGAVPIFDTTLVTLNRLARGISPAHGGKDHTSHRLVCLGLTERLSVLSLYLVSVLLCVLAVLSFYLQPIPFYLLFMVGFVGLCVFGAYLSHLDVYPEELKRDVIGLANFPQALKNRVQLLGVGADLVLIILAFTLAHYIRFEFWSVDIEQAIMNVLPGIILLKLVVFYLFGLYKGIWRHAGVMELLRISMAVFTGTVIAGVFAWIYSAGYLSISVFVIDFMLLSLLIAGTRFGFKGLRRFFSSYLQEGENILLYGAGDAGWLALSEIRNNHALQMNPVGFLDDSEWKKDGVIQGLKVLGNGDDIQEICEKKEIDQVIITISGLDMDLKEKIIAQCNSINVQCKVFHTSFTDFE